MFMEDILYRAGSMVGDRSKPRSGGHGERPTVRRVAVNEHAGKRIVNWQAERSNAVC